MPFNWQHEVQTQAAHLLRMASTPGWQEYAKLRRDQMLADPMWAHDLRAELNRRQREAKAKS